MEKRLLESVLRHHDGIAVSDESIERIASYNATDVGESEIPFVNPITIPIIPNIPNPVDTDVPGPVVISEPAPTDS
ncbi:MAG: hypothetical protein HC779_07180, partial [Phyllobacteriaceae bacterium]|nr:hypothetical protein [Phyllobacteriaceae bacterium]